MKEFSAQNGGRYTYSDDLINLQDLALSFVSIYDGCENFIISGCEVSGSTVSEGYVYINKKIRRFNGATGVSFPCFIYENNSSESIEYVTGGNKVGRNIYGCALGASVPSGNDPLTNAARQSIRLTSSGGPRLKDAFFGANCVLLSKQNQSILGNLSLTGNFSASGTVEANAVTLKTLSIKNASNSVVATFETSRDTLLLKNINGNIVVTGHGYVDIGPAIKENGTLLEDKYVLRSDLPDWVFGDSPASGMTQGQCDARYAKLTNGLSQFIRGTNTSSVLCSQIGAMNQTTADSRYAKITNYLSDMATDETKKATIRSNIGAASVDDIPEAVSIYDSGWVLVKQVNYFYLWGRQYGRVVHIVGTIPCVANGRALFTIPTEISPPSKPTIFCIDRYGQGTASHIFVQYSSSYRAFVVITSWAVSNEEVVVNFTYIA